MINKTEQKFNSSELKKEKKMELEDYLIEIRSILLSKDINYDNVPFIFEEVTEILGEDKYDIFKERIVLKMLYLAYAYDLDISFVNEFMEVAPLLKIDIELNEILSNDKVFQYVLELYKDYRQDTIGFMGALLKNMDQEDFGEALLELSKEIDKLKDIAE